MGSCRLHQVEDSSIVSSDVLLIQEQLPVIRNTLAFAAAEREVLPRVMSKSAKSHDCGGCTVLPYFCYMTVHRTSFFGCQRMEEGRQKPYHDDAFCLPIKLIYTRTNPLS